MQQIGNPHRTMYIKFPTVTKLQYPLQPSPEVSPMRATAYRSNLLRQTQIKIDVISKTESFKIINLPQKHQIMNICRMTMCEKPKEEDTSEQKMPRKKIFSVCKLNSLKILEETEFKALKNPIPIQRSGSIAHIKKVSLPPALNLDYADIYTHITKLIASSYGITVLNVGSNKVRRGKIDHGNNGQLIKQTLKKRIWWTVVNQDSKNQETESLINFLWTQHPLSRRNLQRLIQNNEKCIKKESGRYQQQKFKIPKSFDKTIGQLSRVLQLFFTEWQEQPKRIKDWIFKLSQQPQCKLFPDSLIINNHLPNNCQITNKKLLYKNMVRYYQKIGINPHEKMPKTFHLTCFNWQDVIKNIRGDSVKWILKPGEFTNRGKGITVFRSTKEAVDYILNNPPKTEQRSYLLQEYVTPMLYDQRKFDIRCYMLGVEVGGCLKFFWYDQGYIRTASQKFSLKKVGKGIHLTNDAIQKHLKNYGQHESANKLSYNDIDKYCLNHTTFNFYQEILPEIKRITRDICHSVGDTRLIGAGAGLSFELFGLDYLVDQYGKPWLCQVNTNPSLDICCSLLSRIIPEVLQNTCRLVCDIFLPPNKPPEHAQHFLLNNKFSLIYSSTKTVSQ